jgi:hypothetical protein
MVLFLPLFRDERSGSLSSHYVLPCRDALFVAREKCTNRRTENVPSGVYHAERPFVILSEAKDLVGKCPTRSIWLTFGDSNSSAADEKYFQLFLKQFLGAAF